MASAIQGFVARIGKNLGRTAEEVEPFTELLLDNWYDTPDSLADVTPDDLAKLGIPLRFAKELVAGAGDGGRRGQGSSSGRDEDSRNRGKGGKDSKGQSKGKGKDGKGKDGKGKDGGKDKDKGKGKGKDKGKDKSRDSKGKGKGKDKDGSSNDFREEITLDETVDMDPTYDLAIKILGADNVNVKHVEEATGTRVSLRGAGSGYRDENGMESSEPMSVLLVGRNKSGFNKARDMVNDLLDTVFDEYNTWAAENGQEPSGSGAEEEEKAIDVDGEGSDDRPPKGKSKGKSGKGKGKGKGKDKSKGKGKSKGKKGSKGKSSWEEPPSKRARY